MADLNDVLLAVGRLQEGVDRLRDDFTEEKRSAAASRKAMYERHDELSSELGTLKTDIEISAMVSAQTREEVKSLGGAINKHRQDIEPAIEDWRRMKTLGTGLAGLMAIGGLSVGAMLTWAGEATAATVRRWLGL